MLLTVLLLLPLAMAAPTPQGFSTGVTVRSSVVCSPTICDPRVPDISDGPSIKDPPIISCDPRNCDPLELGLDNSKRSPSTELNPYTGSSTSTTASVRSIDPGPDTETAHYGNILGRREDGVIESRRFGMSDRCGLVEDGNEKLKPKRSLESLSPDQWGIFDSGTGIDNDDGESLDRTTVVLGNGKREVNGELERAVHIGIGNGVVSGSKKGRDVNPFVAFGTDSGIEELIVIVGNGIVTGSKPKLKLKRDGAGKSHWGVGNGNAVQERSGVTVSNQLEKEESSGGDAIFTDWEW